MILMRDMNIQIILFVYKRVKAIAIHYVHNKNIEDKKDKSPTVSALKESNITLVKIFTTFKARYHNKSEKLFGYPKRYPKCDIRNIGLRNPKY